MKININNNEQVYPNRNKLYLYDISIDSSSFDPVSRTEISPNGVREIAESHLSIFIILRENINLATFRRRYASVRIHRLQLLI